MTKREITRFFTKFRYKKHVFTPKSLSNGTVEINGEAALTCTDTGERIFLSDSIRVNTRGLTEMGLLIIMRDWLALLALHENDENIRFNDRKIFDPHKHKNSIW
jgi:hypothetical protein